MLACNKRIMRCFVAEFILAHDALRRNLIFRDWYDVFFLLFFSEDESTASGQFCYSLASSDSRET